MNAASIHPTTTPAGTSRATLIVALLIAGAALVAYHGSFKVPFVLDDALAITENRSIQDLRNLGAVFAPPQDFTTAGRPLLNLSFALNFAWHGRAPTGYHVVNLALHAVAALLLFGVIGRALRARPGAGTAAMPLAAAAALMWAVHPVHTASVTYVSQRAEVLMGVCFLLTLYAFARSREDGERGWLAVAVAACGAGMASKETMVTAPVALLLYDATFFARGIRDALRRRAGFYAAIASTWLGLAALMWSTRVVSRGIGYTATMDPWTHTLTQARVVAAYLKLSVWPHALVFDHGPEIAVRGLAEVAPHIGLLAGTAGGIGWLLRRAPAAGYAGLMFFLTLAPTIAVPVAHQPMAENRLYLPLAAATLLLGLAVWRMGRARVPALAFIIFALIALTVRRNQDYADPLTLWMDTVAKRPANVRARSHLGETLRAAGDTSGAVQQFRAALQMNPDYPAAHNNLGLIYSMDPATRERSIGHFEDALRLEPASPHLHNNLGVVLAQIPGREADAVRRFREALQLRPGYAEAHKNLANVLIRQPGGAAEAVAAYAEALRLTPNDPDAHANLAFGLAISGRGAEARQHFEIALRLKPDHAMAHANFANLLMRAPGGLAPAIGHYRRAVAIDPTMAEAWANLGLALGQVDGRRQEAAEALERALQLRPEFPAAQAALERLRNGK